MKLPEQSLRASNSVLEHLRRRTTCSAALRWARWNLNNSGLSGLLSGLSSGAHPPSHYDLWNLYRNVRKRRPKTIIEFGVGCSTIVMAEALNRNGNGHLISVDCNPNWIAATKESLPRHLHSRVTLHHSPVQIIQYNGDASHRYISLPDETPDLLYLDGPSCHDVPDWGDNPEIAADPLFMEDRFKPGFRLIVDTRLPNVSFLRKHFRRRYKFRYHDIFKVVTFDLVR